MSSGVVTKKSSAAHRAVIVARDVALQVSGSRLRCGMHMGIYNIICTCCRSLCCVWIGWY